MSFESLEKWLSPEDGGSGKASVSGKSDVAWDALQSSKSSKTETESFGGTSVYSVSGLSHEVKRLLDSDSVHNIWVEGEITDYRPNRSGHIYFSLVEQNGSSVKAKIGCVIWKSAARELSFEPVNGDMVRLYGSIDVYEPHGKYQFIALEMMRVGLGDKYILVERWKKELSEEGLFDESHKKSLPPFPKKVGVVTALTGAARRDIENVISRRFPVEIIIADAQVQGEGAHISIAAGVKKLDGIVDVIIVGRGGGSYDDLFEFNHPDVVRAVYDCRTPIISAVGHEVDFTLCDSAADKRAPTPSAAAELAVPDRADLRNGQRMLADRLAKVLSVRLSYEKEKLSELKNNFRKQKVISRINAEHQSVGDLSERLYNAVSNRLKSEKKNLDVFGAKLSASDPKMPLKKGYCMVTSAGGIIRSVNNLKVKDKIEICFGDGRAGAEVFEIVPEVQKQE